MGDKHQEAAVKKGGVKGAITMNLEKPQIKQLKQEAEKLKTQDKKEAAEEEGQVEEELEDALEEEQAEKGLLQTGSVSVKEGGPTHTEEEGIEAAEKHGKAKDAKKQAKMKQDLKDADKHQEAAVKKGGVKGAITMNLEKPQIKQLKQEAEKLKKQDKKDAAAEEAQVEEELEDALEEE